MSDIRRNIERYGTRLVMRIGSQPYTLQDQAGLGVHSLEQRGMEGWALLCSTSWSSMLMSIPRMRAQLLTSSQKRSLLCLANNCCIKDTFKDLRGRFMRLYKRRVCTPSRSIPALRIPLSLLLCAI